MTENYGWLHKYWSHDQAHLKWLQINTVPNLTFDFVTLYYLPCEYSQEWSIEREASEGLIDRQTDWENG